MFLKFWRVKVRIQKKKQQGSNILLLSIVGITKNAPPKVYKVLLNIPDGCSYERCEG